MTRRAEIIYRNAVHELRREMGGIYRALLRELRNNGCTPMIRGDDFHAAVELMQTHLEREVIGMFKRWHAKKSNYEPLFAMPPARRPKSEAKPMTLIERRAVAVNEKVKEWQRKQKLAATKVKAYRKRVQYYKKKGVIA